MSLRFFLGRWAAITVAIFILTSCRKAEVRPPTTPDFYLLTGRVVEIAAARHAVIVHHDPIPGYMPAMTMQFLVSDPELARLHEGARLRAHLLPPDKQGDLHLEAIEVLDPVKEQQITAAANLLRQDTSARGREAYREVGENVPQFALYNQDGEVVSPGRFRGRYVVLNFIYTRCPLANMCPASTMRMMELQAAAKAKGVPNLELVTVSLDPAYDTPPVLREYAKVRGINTGNFTFLTGPEGAVRDLLVQFGIIVEPGEDYLRHTLATLLINGDGKIVHRVDGTQWTPDEFLSRVR